MAADLAQSRQAVFMCWAGPYGGASIKPLCSTFITSAETDPVSLSTLEASFRTFRITGVSTMVASAEFGPSRLQGELPLDEDARLFPFRDQGLDLGIPFLLGGDAAL